METLTRRPHSVQSKPQPTSRPVASVLATKVDVMTTEQQRWRELVADLGAEVAAPLTSALERINSLTSIGRIDKNGLRALREEVEAARQIGMVGQQLTRFASGRVRQLHEKLQLTEVLRSVLVHRARETRARGIALSPLLKPAEVLVDASLLFSLLNATLDWAMVNAESNIDFRIDLKTDPTNARLSCSFVHCPIDALIDGPNARVPRGLDSLTWRLIEQTAWTMGLGIERIDERHKTTLVIEFPRDAGRALNKWVTSDLKNDGSASSGNSLPLAGSHVLVIASRRDMRAQMSDALRNMGLIIDFVSSVDEAAAFCKEGLPHAVIIESIQSDERFACFRDEINAQVPDFVFVEIIEQGSAFERSGAHSDRVARVGRDGLATSLPATLLFELSKVL